MGSQVRVTDDLTMLTKGFEMPRLQAAHKCRYMRSGERTVGVSRSAWAGWEVLMGNKDKGGKNTKKVAARSPKEKRADKKAKQKALKGKGSSGTF